MRVVTIIAIVIYTFLFSVIGAMLIALSLSAASLDLITSTINSMVHSENIRTGLAVTGLALILINIFIAQFSIGRLKKYKTIAFENPDGPVTLSLAAIEEHIRKLTARMPEVKDIKFSISTTKGGVEVNARVAIYSGLNIPEITEKIQNAIRQRLHEILGIEEKFIIKIHISKIVSKETKSIDQKSVLTNAEHGGFKGEIDYGR